MIDPDDIPGAETLTDGDADFATRWRLIKTAFSHGLPRGEPISASRAGKRERGVWQRRYWEHTLRDQDDFIHRASRLHSLQSGYAPRVRDWPYSSFRRWVRLGAYPEDWAGDLSPEAHPFGER
jgi:putative transposase